MTGFQVCIVALVVGGLGPAFVLAATGRPTNRLIGLEMGSATLTVLFVVFTEVSGFSFDLILALVLVPLSFAGTLVFTRLISPDKPPAQKEERSR